MVSAGVLLAGALIATAASTAIQVISTQQQARVAGQVARRNASQAEADAEQQGLLIDREAAAVETDRQRELFVLGTELQRFDEDVAQFQGQETAAIGASGFEFSGSPILIAMENARRAALGRANIIFQSEQRQRQLEDQTGLLRFQAGQVRRRGEAAPAIGAFEARNLQTAANVGSLAIGLSGAARVGQVLQARRPPTTSPLPVQPASVSSMIGP